MSYSPILLLHILAGTLGMFSGAVAIIARKGSRPHILAGRIFVFSMLFMATGAIYLAIVKNQPSNIGGGFLTFYLIGTAWLAARRKGWGTSPVEWLAVLIPLGIGILGWRNGIDALHSPDGTKYGAPAGMHMFIGTICLLAAAGDIRMFIRGGIVGTARIARHLWRMCFGLFIASGSFFLGPNNRPLRLVSSIGLGHLPAPLFSLGFYLALTLLPLLLLIFWLLRIRFSRSYNRQQQPAPTAP